MVGWGRVLTACGLLLIFVDAWQISAPTSKKDWRDLSSLVVECFDAPAASDAPWLEQVRWDWVDRDATREMVYQMYVKTALKMKGTKYALFLAKADNDQVVGMAELGLSENKVVESRIATVGVLCVAPEFRKLGVGKDLISRCEQLVSDVWGEDSLFSEVEVGNKPALAFFQDQGFVVANERTVQVNVRKGLRIESRPHVLLRKNLLDPDRSR